MITARIRLVALDVDGTLVGPDTTISPGVLDAIRKGRARGAEFTIVTGRMFAAAKRFAEQIGITGAIVCYQGAAIFEVATGKLLRQTPVPQDVTVAVLDWCAEHKVHAQCYADDVLYLEAVNAFSERYTQLAKVTPTVIPSLLGMFTTTPTIKIVLVDNPGPALEHLAALQALLGDRAYLTRSHPDFVEVLSPNINKGEALAFVAGYYGASLAETMAVGDAWNDVPLISAAGIGIAMGSGPPELFAHAQAVVGDVQHDGVAEAIERYILR
jgi:Cof subfamily protein (haloacid dehalogenase superfamily)